MFSFLWLERCPSVSKQEREYRVESMRRNQDAVYSEGFKQALAAFYACGSSLTRVLEQVKQTRTLGVAIGRPGVAVAKSPISRGGRH